MSSPTITSTETTSASYSNYYASSYQTSTSSTSYRKISTFADDYDPYVIHHHDVNGTVFIAVGTIILSLFAILLVARFWFWMKNRRAVRAASQFDDYYGGGGSGGTGYDEKDLSYFTYDSTIFGEKKNPNGIYLSSPGQYSTTQTEFTQSSSSSYHNHNISDSQNSPDLSNLTSQQGRHLRNALTQSYIPPKTRTSFISPINQLIQEQQVYSTDSFDTSNESYPNQSRISHQRLSSSQLLSNVFNAPTVSATSPTPGTPNTTTTIPDSTTSSNTNESKESHKRKTQSISYLLNPISPNLNENFTLTSDSIKEPHVNFMNNNSGNSTPKQQSHNKSKSFNFYELERLVNKSLIDVNSRDNLLGKSSNGHNDNKKSPNLSATFGKLDNGNSSSNVDLSLGSNGKKETRRTPRPPSLVLDMLVQNDLNK